MLRTETAMQISLLAAPIFAALIYRGSVADLENPEWQKSARAAAIRQAKLLWIDTCDGTTKVEG